jgi:cytidylate kinase
MMAARIAPYNNILPQHMIVAIDGPAGAGKSTVARAVAGELGYVYIDSGAMYRAVALEALREGVALDDHIRLERLARGDRIRPGSSADDAIRAPEVSAAASRVSAIPGVRRALVEKQREMAESAAVVMEGRDIGTVVFPGAHVKIYLDADPRERARRRAIDLGSAGDREEMERLAAELAERDERDATRADSPLRRAPDAVMVDTTGRTIGDVVGEIVALVRARSASGKGAKG